MLPGVGVSEYILIAIAALVVIGPKDLPILMRKAGAFINRLRGMAAEFRASFDEMARQSELDELRKQVEELRSGQLMQPITSEIAPAMTQIETDIRAGVGGDWSAPADAGPIEEPDTQGPPTPVRKRKAAPRAKAAPKAAPKSAARPAPKASPRTSTKPAKSAPAKAARAPARKASAPAKPPAKGRKS